MAIWSGPTPSCRSHSHGSHTCRGSHRVNTVILDEGVQRHASGSMKGAGQCLGTQLRAGGERKGLCHGEFLLQPSRAPSVLPLSLRGRRCPRDHAGLPADQFPQDEVPAPEGLSGVTCLHSRPYSSFTPGSFCSGLTWLPAQASTLCPCRKVWVTVQGTA